MGLFIDPKELRDGIISAISTGQDSEHIQPRISIRVSLETWRLALWPRDIGEKGKGGGGGKLTSQAISRATETTCLSKVGNWINKLT